MSATDVAGIVGICFALAIAFLVSTYFVGEVVDKFKTVPSISSNPDSVANMDVAKTLTYKFDYVFLGVFVGLIIGLIITSWFISGNPIFMFIYFLAIIVIDVASFIIANSWETISSASFLSGSLHHYPITNFIMLHLPYFITVIGMIGLVVMFAKPNVVGGDAGI